MKCLLSIDWDYFIHTKKENWNSYLENDKNTVKLWYKRYIQSKAQGKDIKKFFLLSSEIIVFWNKVKEYFQFEKNTKILVSDSHALSYNIAKENNCNTVYLFDAHADLGYGGLSALDFEVNCANWLGQLLKDKIVKRAYIIYSPFTVEKPEYFKHMNSVYNIKYRRLKELGKGINVSVIHICRSGAWTPPWLDNRFYQFISASGIPYEIVNCPPRKWDTKNISFSDAIYYMMA
ncbi:MAG TPA: arginase [Clostridiaceae bacterium]|nr:arginase [Clostridiaceae bacterium]